MTTFFTSQNISVLTVSAINLVFLPLFFWYWFSIGSAPWHESKQGVRLHKENSYMTDMLNRTHFTWRTLCISQRIAQVNEKKYV